MNWEWLKSKGLIEGDMNWYADGSANADEYAHAIQTAYKNATDPALRKELVDMLWGTGMFSGQKEYWYEDRTAEVGSLGQAAKGFDIEGGQELKSVGGKPQVWKVGDKVYLVHSTTAADGSPIRLAWEAPSMEDVQSFFGPDQEIVYNQTMNVLPPDVLPFGTTDELANMTGDPIETWKNTLETEAKTQPWLLDSDYQALSLMAVLEGRPVSESEIKTTDWWQNNTAAQRQWMTLFHGDPTTAQQKIDDFRVQARTQLEGMGVANPSDAIVNAMADQFAMGNWSATYYQNQLKAVSDPASGIQIDEIVQTAIGEDPLDTTRKFEDVVRNMAVQWLGPGFGGWDDALVEEWAGKLRNDPDAALALEESLKDQKQGLFGGYDREMSYNAIVSPWREFMRNQWGTTPDEDDPLFHSIVNLNDAAEAGKVLTEEGLKRGNQTVVNKMQADLVNTFGGSVR